MTELIEATKNSDIELVRKLLASESNPNESDDSGRTPLIWAAIAGETEIVLTLLAHHARLDIADDLGRTALKHALRANHADTTRALLGAGADPDNRDLLLAFHGSERHTPPKKDVWDKLKAISGAFAAIAIPIVLGGMGHCVNLTIKEQETGAQLVELALEILRQPPEGLADASGLYDWARKAINEHSEDNKLQAPKDGARGIFLYGSTIERLLAISKGKDPGSEEVRTSASQALNFILLERARAGELDTVKKLLTEGVDPNVSDAARNTPLMYAVASDRLPVVRELLRHKNLQIDAGNDDDQTALHIAAREGRSKIVAALVAGGADPALRNRNGFNPFQLAAREKNVESFLELLKSKHATEDLLYEKQNKDHLSAVALAQDQPEMEKGLRKKEISLFWEKGSE